MFCTIGRPLRLITWLTVPFLFSGAVLGLTGLGGLLVGAPGPPALSSPVFGAGVAVGVAASGMVTWSARWQRVWVRWPYLGAVLLLGVFLDGVRLPLPIVLALGIPLTLLLIAQYFVERSRTAALVEARRVSFDTRC